MASADRAEYLLVDSIYSALSGQVRIRMRTMRRRPALAVQVRWPTLILQQTACGPGEEQLSIGVDK